MESITRRLVILKNLLGFFVTYAARIKRRPQVKHAGEKVAVFSFVTRDYRYYYPILRHLSGAGYTCYLKVDRRFLQPTDPHFQLILNVENLYFALKLEGAEKADFLVVEEGNRTDRIPGVKTIVLSDAIFSMDGNFKTQNIIPFSVHPIQYPHLSGAKIQKLRETKRSLKVFFLGNTSRALYRDENLSIFHKKLSRNQIIEAVVEDFGNQVGTQPLPEYLDRPIQLYKPDDWPKNEAESYDSSIANWMPQLAQTNFFLACPGFAQPMCHSLTEAMAIGTIPILEHPEYLFPPLENKKNCIAFAGKSGLKQAIEEVLAMTVAEIELMRSNVVDYYEEHLSGAAVVSMFEQAPDNSTLYYYSSGQSLKEYARLHKQRKQQQQQPAL
ncbi:hypothetical protein [Hymenobacter sp. IS2118]|uniref:hypothetical protein n=1 Tax=Hymenobacter sp. IS2118 TaxID=1505605 RepID=UPI0005596893|nr:hypothetical protein [Hymenobacter sp. IS2118]